MRSNSLVAFGVLLLTLSCCKGERITGPPGSCCSGQVDTEGAKDPSLHWPVSFRATPTTSIRPPVNEKPFLVFMSFNIQSGYSYNCDDVIDQQAEFTKSVSPDFVGYQEADIDVDIRCNCSMPQVIADHTGMTAFFFQFFPWRTGRYGDMSATSHDVILTQYHYFKVLTPGSETRGAFAHLLQPPQLRGRYLWAINTHTEFYNGDVRAEQCQDLVRWVNDDLLLQHPQALVVITGDFYTVPGHATYNILAEHFVNTWTVWNNGSEAGGFNHPSKYPNERFDHIWYKVPAGSDIQVHVIDYKLPEIYLSDHLPIVVTLNFTLPAEISVTTEGPIFTPPITEGPTKTTSPYSTTTTAPTNETKIPTPDDEGVNPVKTSDSTIITTSYYVFIALLCYVVTLFM